jgi:hypothetical protein
VFSVPGFLYPCHLSEQLTFPVFYAILYKGLLWDFIEKSLDFYNFWTNPLAASARIAGKELWTFSKDSKSIFIETIPDS